MKYLLLFIRGIPHYVNGAQILTMDDKLHTEKLARSCTKKKKISQTNFSYKRQLLNKINYNDGILQSHEECFCHSVTTFLNSESEIDLYYIYTFMRKKSVTRITRRQVKA